MKEIIFIFCLFLTNALSAQETIVLPSSFDENQMIVKKMDTDGNFIPMEQFDNSVVEKNVLPTSILEKNNEQQVEINQINSDKQQTFSEETDQTIKMTPRTHVRKFRAVKKDYSIPKTTFSDSTYQKVEVPQNPTFQMPTMTKAVKDFERESTSFEECDSDDPNCKVYEINEKGQVVF